MTAAKITAFAAFSAFAAMMGLWGLPAHATKGVQLGTTDTFMQQQPPQCKKGWVWDKDKKKCVRQTRGSY